MVLFAGFGFKTFPVTKTDSEVGCTGFISIFELQELKINIVGNNRMTVLRFSFIFRYLLCLVKLGITLSICKVGDWGLQTYHTVTILKRATTLEFTTISPILYIHC